MIIKLKITRAENCAHYGVSSGSVIMLDLEEEYLPICVASEIYESNSRTPMEAKKVQAIAARTYIAAHALAGTTIDDTADYQAFKWKDLSTIQNSVQAVKETRGQVLLCDDSLITAWYSNSNGGRTKRSDEAWSVYKKWTISQDDPWDTAGRTMWGQYAASHCVGMSQIGAAYAAYAGENYILILSFYYPNTDIVSDYGKGDTIYNHKSEEKAMSDDKTNTGLVEHALGWLGNPYWYGTCCYKCTSSLLASKSAQYPSHYTQDRMPRYKQDISGGKYCADCIGLIKGYYWEKDGKIVYDASSDVNTTGMYNKAKVKGLIGTIPEVPGLIVYKSGHVGVYEGNGSVIEAKGFSYGCIRSKLSDTAWTHWLVCPYISYAGYEKLLVPEAFTDPYIAQVTTKSSPLNIWSDTKKTKSLGQVAKGDTVSVIGYGGEIGWMKVTKDSVTGFADGQYLTKVDSVEVNTIDDDATDTDSPTQTGDTILYNAKVTGVKIGLNFRSSPSKSEGNTIAFLANDTIVGVLEENINGFSYVIYQGAKGYCTASYLTKGITF